MSKRRVLVSGLVVAAAALSATHAEPFEQALIPVFASEPRPGVNGSLWTTDLWVSNSADSSARIEGLVWNCLLPECFLPAPLPPEVAIRARPFEGESLRGVFVIVG